MPTQEYQLSETAPGVYSRAAPALVMVGRWGLTFQVTPKPTFVPWFGALAHAIFFRKGSLDYFHTHICAPNAPNCGTLPGVASSRISGTSTAPGKLTIGVLLPAPGTWRLFLQMKLGGRIVTAPYTLEVAS
jgi:hypothetical protein